MRITGGAHRSRSLAAPRGSATRPTSDRVREALFSILSSRRPFDGLRVLDLYAGTGALALEALSRGAAHAVLVDRAKEACAAIRTNIDALGERGRTELLPLPLERAVKTLAPHTPFDLILVDPPYADLGHAAELIESLLGVENSGSGGLLADGGTVVLEHSSRDAPPTLKGLALESSRIYGDSALSFYEKSR